MLLRLDSLKTRTALAIASVVVEILVANAVYLIVATGGLDHRRLGLLVGIAVLESAAARSLALRFLDFVPRILVALLFAVAGATGSRAMERSILIGAVNMGLQSARLLGLGARWLLLILAGAMALEQLGIGGTILTAAFAILFGGIVLSLALAIGLGSKELVARSLERRLHEQPDRQEPGSRDQVHHL